MVWPPTFQHMKFALQESVMMKDAYVGQLFLSNGRNAAHLYVIMQVVTQPKTQWIAKVLDGLKSIQMESNQEEGITLI